VLTLVAAVIITFGLSLHRRLLARSRASGDDA
jgi:hypothetical protein